MDDALLTLLINLTCYPIRYYLTTLSRTQKIQNKTYFLSALFAVYKLSHFFALTFYGVLHTVNCQTFSYFLAGYNVFFYSFDIFKNRNTEQLFEFVFFVFIQWKNTGWIHIYSPFIKTLYCPTCGTICVPYFLWFYHFLQWINQKAFSAQPLTYPVSFHIFLKWVEVSNSHKYLFIRYSVSLACLFSPSSYPYFKAESFLPSSFHSDLRLCSIRLNATLEALSRFPQKVFNLLEASSLFGSSFCLLSPRHYIPYLHLTKFQDISRLEVVLSSHDLFTMFIIFDPYDHRFCFLHINFNFVVLTFLIIQLLYHFTGWLSASSAKPCAFYSSSIYATYRTIKLNFPQYLHTLTIGSVYIFRKKFLCATSSWQNRQSQVFVYVTIVIHI